MGFTSRMRKIAKKHPETAAAIEQISAKKMYSTAQLGKLVNGREEMRLTFHCERSYIMRSRWTRARFALFIVWQSLGGFFKALRSK